MPTATLLAALLAAALLPPGLLLIAALLARPLTLLAPLPLTPTAATLTRLTRLLPGLLLTRLLARLLTRLLARLLTARLLLPWLLAPSATPLLGWLALRRVLLRLLGLLLTRALAPSAAALARLLSPATLAGCTRSPLSLLLPARLAPRLPRTPGPLWRRRHIRSLETHV